MNNENMTPTTQADDRLSHLHDAYVAKVNAALDAGRDDLVREFAQAFDEESAELTGVHTLDRRPGRRTPHTRAPRAAAPATSRVRASLRRFDRYTLEVMNPGHPYRTRTDRSA
jgi:hypothetical protein